MLDLFRSLKSKVCFVSCLLLLKWHAEKKPQPFSHVAHGRRKKKRCFARKNESPPPQPPPPLCNARRPPPNMTLLSLQQQQQDSGGPPETLKWVTSKRHFRETEEWKIKRTRILTKMRCLGKINLALIISRMPVSRARAAAAASCC